MKKIILAATFMLLISTISFAQESKSTGGFRRGGGGNPHMKETIKHRLQQELQLTEAQADSVATIHMDFQKRNREITENVNISEGDKKLMLAETEVLERKKLKALLTEEQIETLKVLRENMRKKREERRNKKD